MQRHIDSGETCNKIVVANVRGLCKHRLCQHRTSGRYGIQSRRKSIDQWRRRELVLAAKCLQSIVWL